MENIEDIQNKIDNKIEELESQTAEESHSEEGQIMTDLIKKSDEELGDLTEEEIRKADDRIESHLREKLGEEKYRVYLAAINNQDEAIIAEIGRERFNAILDEATEILRAEQSEYTSSMNE